MSADVPDPGTGPEEAPVRVVLADDHAGIRARIREALQSGDCAVLAEGATAAQAVALTGEHRPDVVLLDIHMPGNGIHAAREIATAYPEVAIVMLTQSADEDDLFDSLRAGAVGYLLKDMDTRLLPAALRGVLAGEGAVSPRLLLRVLDEFRAPTKRRFGRRSAAAGRLSPREWEIMSLLASGRSTDEVARELFLSPTTIRVHVSTVLKKLRVKDRESALRLLREE